MLNGLPSFQATNRSVARSRRSMLETLVRHLDMVRLTVAAAVILAFTGCSGLIDDGGDGGLTAEQIHARDLWINKALPALRATNTNCTSCHDGSRANIGFVVGANDLDSR